VSGEPAIHFFKDNVFRKHKIIISSVIPNSTVYIALVVSAFPHPQHTWILKQVQDDNPHYRHAEFDTAFETERTILNSHTISSTVMSYSAALIP